MAYEPPPVAVAAHLTFGLAGNADKELLDGWSMPEAGYRWSIDQGGRLLIPYAAGEGTLVLEISVVPMVLPRVVPSQRLIVEVNGVQVGDEDVAGESTLGFAVPAEALRLSRELIVTLRQPGAIVPVELGINPDARRLGFAVSEVLLLWSRDEAAFTPRQRPPLPAGVPLADAVRGLTALDPTALLFRFESLGSNCEFGFVQRGLNAEPLSLLRFGGISPQRLLRGLDSAFEGIDDIARLRAFPGDDDNYPEYMIRDDRYSAEFHTTCFVGDIEKADLIRKWSVHLRFLQRKLQESLTDGKSIFVLHDRACRTKAQVLPILNVLRSHGPNALLFVTPDRSAPPGTVDQIMPDLFQGRIDRLAHMYDPSKINLGAWASICANTYRMWRESGFGG